MRDQEIVGLWEAYQQVYAPQQLSEEVEIAAQYFYEMGLNEDGVDILIEELGVEEFTEFVYDIAEEYVLTEARAGGSKIEPKLASGKEIKGKPKAATLKRLRAQKEARKESEERASSEKPSGMKASLKRQSAVAAAAKKQPKKPGLLDRVAGAVNRGIQRHNAAMSAARETGKVISKAAKGAGQVAREVGKGASGTLKLAGHVATKGLKEEVEEWVNALVEEGYDLSEYTWEDMCEMYLDEGRNTSLQALAREKHNKQNPQGKFDRDKRLMMGHNSPGAYKYKKDPETGRWSNEGRRDGATESELRKKVSQRSLRNRRGNVDAVPKKNGRPMFESAEDLFDYLLEYLVAEGYADTNKAALAIMANMSEEWKQSIVEGDALRNTIKTLEGKRDAMNANKPGSANTAAPGKQSVGAATYKAYQRLRGV